MGKAVKAGVVYFLIVFAAGLALGALRVLVVVPRIGAVGAVAAELPVILGVSWVAAGRLVDRFAVPPGAAARAAMGATGFVVLILAETVLGRFLFQRPLADQIAALGAVPGMLGLLGQIGFGLIPLAVRRRRP